MTIMRWFGKRRLVPAVALAVIATTAPVAASAAIAGTPAVTKPSPRVPVLRWHACDRTFQCSTARVPLDYQHPDGTMISIAVIRHLATDPAHRLGSLFFNSGGPFEQIKPFISAYPQIPAPLRARFDVISFDPRGYGFSTAIHCFPSLGAERKFLAGQPLFPVGHRQEVAWARTAARFDAQCASHGGPLLDHDSSADVARDMDLIRQAVGDPVLNYLGQSYGTGLGAIYANLFPSRVGRMVFDGNLDPVAWTHGGSVPSGLRDREDVADAQTMRALLSLCGKVPTSACAFSAGTPAATRAKFATLAQRLLHAPITIGREPALSFTYADVFAFFPEDDFAFWPDDAATLQQLWLASAPGTHQRPGVSPVPPLPPIDQITATECADSPEPRNPHTYEVAVKQAARKEGGFGILAGWGGELCARWPAAAAQDRYTGPWNRPTANPILLIGNTVDPATPYWNSVAMAHDLDRARLLTVEGYGHTEFTNPSTCAANDEIRYFTAGILPKAGAVCGQNAKPFQPPAP